MFLGVASVLLIPLAWGLLPGTSGAARATDGPGIVDGPLFATGIGAAVETIVGAALIGFAATLFLTTLTRTILRVSATVRHNTQDYHG